jgi:hypothetical protein
MDDYEGVNAEPLSLHKYLYVYSNPVNGIDPSGKWLIGLLSSRIIQSMFIGGSLNAIITGFGYMLDDEDNTATEVISGMFKSFATGAGTALVGGVVGKFVLRFVTRITDLMIRAAIAGGAGAATNQIIKEAYAVLYEGKPIDIVHRSGKVFAAATIGALVGGMSFNLRPLSVNNVNHQGVNFKMKDGFVVSWPWMEACVRQISFSSHGMAGATAAHVIARGFNEISHFFDDLLP